MLRGGGGGRGRGGPLVSSHTITSHRLSNSFVFSSQGGGMQKWKPLTQSPEPQRYNLPHHSLTFIFELWHLLFCLYTHLFMATSSSCEQPQPGVKGPHSNSDLWWRQRFLCKILLEACHEFSWILREMRDVVLTSQSNRTFTVPFVCWTQKSSCVADKLFTLSSNVVWT